ncbi:MAG: RNA 2',3'-cyclic phosphodiesterase [bacterium]|nr:RNA 2',3'-cyclic phosphodiesterase [bacterium]
MASIRIFVALELPGVVRQILADTQSNLDFLDRKVRWVRPEGMHLTLKFVGDVCEGQVPVIVSAVQEAAANTQVLRLSTSGMGGFPNLDRARVVWVGIQGDLEPLRDLQGRVDDLLEGAGFPAEKRRFFPHVTFGRARRNPVQVPKDRAGPVPSVHFQVDRVTVIKSELKPDGAVYSPLGYGLLD